MPVHKIIRILDEFIREINRKEALYIIFGVDVGTSISSKLKRELQAHKNIYKKALSQGLWVDDNRLKEAINKFENYLRNEKEYNSYFLKKEFKEKKLFKISNNISKFEFAFTKEEIDDVLDFSHFIEFWDKLPGYTILFLGSNNILISSPEFDLFESACWFHNEALKSNDMNVDGWEEDLFGQKQSIHHKNMCRQTIINSFLFLEAFINSLAYDFAEKNKNISKEDKLFLTEKTINKQGKKVQRFVSIEDKLHKWVKIMSPRSETFDKGRLPFQDFKEIKKVRDTIIHLTNKKVEYFRSINLEFAQKALDVSVEMVKEISRFISHDKVEYPFWLKDKDEDGFYNVSRYYKIDDDVFEKLKEPIIN